VFIRGYSLHFFFVPEPVRRSFCEGGWLCGYEVIMQNKPNFPKPKMVVTLVITVTNNNEQRTTNYSKQTQSNPIANQPTHFSKFPPKTSVFLIFYLFLFSFSPLRHLPASSYVCSVAEIILLTVWFSLK
jgi:hypothetical protein